MLRDDRRQGATDGHTSPQRPVTTQHPLRPIRTKRPRASGRRQADELQFERLFSQLSSAFAKFQDTEVDAAIDVWLRRLVKFLRVDQAGLSQVVADGHAVRLTHFQGVRDSSSHPGSVPHDDVSWFTEHVRSGSIVRLERVPHNFLPSEASQDSAHIMKMGIKSYLMLPLTMTGANVGALAFATVRRYRRWPDDLVRRLQLVAQVFGNALARRQARRELKERLTFERLITKLVGMFVRVSVSEVDERIREGLKRLVECLRVDEVTLGQVSENGAVVIRSRAARAGASCELTCVSVPRWVDALRDGHIVVANSRNEVAFFDLGGSDSELTTRSRHGPSDLSRTSPSRPSPIVFDRGSEAKLDRVQTHVSIPLVTENRLWGAITAVAFDRPREWTTWEIHRLRLVGEIMMEAAVRCEIEDKSRRQVSEMTAAAQVVALGQLTAALAHELNQPLTAIRMNAQTARRLLATGHDSELPEIATDIAADASRAAGLIVRLRNLLRRHEVEKVVLDLNQVIEDARHNADGEAHRHGASLVLRLESGLPRIRGDAMQLQQVLLNLVRNAAEAMGGTIAASQVVVRTRATPPDHVTASIEDTGPRIDDASFERMFAAFHTTKPDGLGMGLAISQSIIEAHGGRLWAERKPDRGLIVRFSVPASADIP